MRRGAADRTGSSARRNRPDALCSSRALIADLGGRSGGGAEPQPSPVGQPDHPLRPEDRRQGLQQVRHSPCGRDDDAVSRQPSPGDVGAMLTVTPSSVRAPDV
jgi:hypothetical protein